MHGVVRSISKFLLLAAVPFAFAACTPAKAKRAGDLRKFELKHGLWQEFAWIPPGDFMMGSPVSEIVHPDEAQVKVTISHGFWMARNEMTRDQWKFLTGKDPGEFEIMRGRALENVSWDDSVEWISKLPPPEKGWHYDLPTEAQWEYACRARSEAAVELNKTAWWHENSAGQTHLVSQKAPNPWGLFDMQGNVAEWCKDTYKDRLPGGKDPLVTDPNPRAFRVLRGGSWDSTDACRPACRNKETPALRLNRVGFRLVIVQDA